jgi:acyl phosphate:glycerol-3-phosphate acyltransferase
MNAFNYFSISVLSFLIGSFPTAFLLVRKHSGKDLRAEGSGNIGALNAFEVSKSKRIGILVLLIDLIKGAIPLGLVHLVVGDDFLAGSLAMIFVVAGHNYSPWIGFKGGRGLASAAGATILYNPFLLFLWAASWVIVFAIRRDVHVGNIAATIIAPIIGWSLPSVVRGFSQFTCPDSLQIAIASGILFGLIFLKHLGPLRDLLSKNS